MGDVSCVGGIGAWFCLFQKKLAWVKRMVSVKILTQVVWAHEIWSWVKKWCGLKFCRGSKKHGRLKFRRESEKRHGFKCLVI